MAERHKDHWEALFDSTYMRWFNLCGSPALVRITKVERLVKMVMRGGVEKRASVLHFEQVQGKIDTVKPLVLNRTNTETIKAIHGDLVPGWYGKEIVLVPAETQLGRDTVDCIRVRAKKEQ